MIEAVEMMVEKLVCESKKKSTQTHQLHQGKKKKTLRFKLDFRFLPPIHCPLMCCTLSPFEAGEALCHG